MCPFPWVGAASRGHKGAIAKLQVDSEGHALDVLEVLGVADQHRDELLDLEGRQSERLCLDLHDHGLELGQRVNGTGGDLEPPKLDQSNGDGDRDRPPHAPADSIRPATA